MKLLTLFSHNCTQHQKLYKTDRVQSSVLINTWISTDFLVFGLQFSFVSVHCFSIVNVVLVPVLVFC